MSHRDTAQLIQKAVEAPPSVGFAIVHGMSDNDLKIWDISDGERLIGYKPEDGAGEDWTPIEGQRDFMGR